MNGTSWIAIRLESCPYQALLSSFLRVCFCCCDSSSRRAASSICCLDLIRGHLKHLIATLLRTRSITKSVQ